MAGRGRHDREPLCSNSLNARYAFAGCVWIDSASLRHITPATFGEPYSPGVSLRVCAARERRTQG